MKGTISSYKIQKVADIMSKTLDATIKEKENETTEMLNTELMKLVPNIVKEVFAKYPEKIKKQEIRSRFINKRYHVFKINVPRVCSLQELEEALNETNESGSSMSKKFKVFLSELDVLTRKQAEIKERIKTAISSIKTYGKLKTEFPEAYKVLIEQVDNKIFIEDSKNSENIKELRNEILKTKTKKI